MKTIGKEKLGDGNTGTAGAVYHYLTVFFLLMNHLEGVDDTG